MALADWFRVIDEARSLGVKMVQFIGGEPTTHPGLPGLIERALLRRVEVEIYSNLFHVRPELWEVFAQPGVRLATSYYAADPVQHEAITRGRGSFRRTRGNIVEALRRSIPLRVGIVDVHGGRHADQARAELASLGVVEIGVDGVRQVGRGARGSTAEVSQLCGNCARGVLAVSPEGVVWPCVFSRWLSIGNVREHSLAEIVGGERCRSVRAELAERFPLLAGHACDPRCEPYTAGCHPECNPSCSPRCDPISCRPTCLPPPR